MRPNPATEEITEHLDAIEELCDSGALPVGTEDLDDLAGAIRDAVSKIRETITATCGDD